MKSPLGGKGYGFDFQIDPYRFGGQRATITSVPYPVVVNEEIDGRVEGAFDTELIQNLEEFEASSRALDGSVRDILVVVSIPTDALDVTIDALDGTLAQILKTYGYGPESFDVESSGFDGWIKRILIVINMPTDAFDAVASICTGGTLQ